MERIQLVYRNGKWFDCKYGDEWELFDFQLAYRQGKTQVWDTDAQEYVRIIKDKSHVIFKWKDFELVVYGKSLKYL